MKSIIALLSGFVITIAAGFVPLGIARAQPPGWPCDYGFRPGNTWFYNSDQFGNKIYSLTVVRDSIGADGAYWVYVAASALTSGHWYRIDSACTFDAYDHPPTGTFRREFMMAADLGDSWLVDSAGLSSGSFARIVSTGRYGTSFKTKKVLYYQVDDNGDIWENHSDEWAEGIGIINRFIHAGYADRLIGRIIDGVAYGYRSSVSDVEHSADSCATLRLF